QHRAGGLRRSERLATSWWHRVCDRVGEEERVGDDGDAKERPRRLVRVLRWLPGRWASGDLYVPGDGTLLGRREGDERLCLWTIRGRDRNPAVVRQADGETTA